MKRVINAALFFLLIIFLLAFGSITIESFTGGEFGDAIISLILAAVTFGGVRKTYRNAFGDHSDMAQNQQQIPQQEMFNPEMDHADDMSMQYNPYFADVYAEQEEALRREQQQQMQQQRLQNSAMQQQMVRQQAQQAQLQAELLEQQAQELRARAEEMQRQADMTRLQ